ncbi:MAG: hypothetical protein BRD28_04290 [Bacteroidetes bacterium QH_10_64_37]|jgi:hypothetical protein|nr:MAG: hypothetical protein BRD28_04290 [Bacteroidetes bacterium QH_10_64_37]
MHYVSRIRILLLLPLLTLGLALTGCDSGGSSMDDDTDENIDVPSTYTFQSRFADGESAVAYPGQVTRNLLIADLKFQTDALGQSGASSTSSLLRRYTENSENLSDLDILVPNKFGFEALDSQQNYGDIATGKSLQGKATSSYADSKTLIGSADLAITGNSDVTADELIRLYLNRIQSNSQDDGQLGTPAVYTTDDNVNMSQLVNKLLLGSVAYSQGTEKYLDDVLDTEASPNTQDGDNPYSTLGHVWDEAFGYYGAARDFSASGVYYDSDGLLANFDDRNGDGAIDLSSEFVYTWADYSVDRGVVNDIGFHTELFESFREGRTAIINQRPLETIRGHAADARAAWDRLVAANVVHYLNSMAGDLSDLSSDETVTESSLGEDAALEFNEHWGEAKPFAWALQYNPDKQISDAQLQTLHDELGAAPPYGMTKSEVISKIDAAKGILQSAYGFPDANMENW